MDVDSTDETSGSPSILMVDETNSFYIFDSPETSTFLFQKANASSQIPPTASLYETNTTNEMLHSDWSTHMFQNNPKYINSGNNMNSSTKTQKLMSTQSNAVNGMPLAHLGDPGKSRQSALSESENASLLSPNETLRYIERSSSMIMDVSDEEMYYIAENRDVSYATLVNLSPRSSTGSADIEPQTPTPIPLSRNFNYVGQSVKRQVRISVVPVYASFQRGQYQLKCIKLNKYQPVECFEILDAATGLRANRSSSGKAKDDNRNLNLNAEVGFIYPLYPNHKIQKLDQWLGIWSHFVEEFC